MTDLSLVLVSWDTRDMTLESLTAIDRALRGPDSPLATEVLLVDNGSRDGTAEAVRARFPETRVIALSHNLGFAGGNNAALPHCRGRVIGLVNTDVEVERSAVMRCMDVLDSEPDIAVVGPQLLHEDGRLQNSVHAFPSLATELLPKWMLETLLPGRFPSKRVLHEAPTDVEAVQGAAFFVRRVVVDEVGPLCDDYFFFLEETEWCLRMRAAGYRVVHVPDARLVHRSGASSKRLHAAATRIEYHRSLYRFLERHRGPAARDAVRIARVVRSLPRWLGWLVAAPFSASARERFRERDAVLRWHLAGCPERGGLRDL